MTEHTKIVPNGTVVRYHGSLRGYHGVGTVVDFHKEIVPTDGEYSPVRYVLNFGPLDGDSIHNVRPESFTLVEKPLKRALFTDEWVPDE